MFQALALIGGSAGSIAVTVLLLQHHPETQTPDELALNILLAIGAGFVAAGFISWSVVQIKELTMAIADWIREATEKRRRQIADEALARGRREGRDEALAQGREEGRKEGYQIGYADGSQGKPMQPPSENPEQSSC